MDGKRARRRPLRDGEGYSITPHTDAVAKAVSMLYYLPRDDSGAEMGTRTRNLMCCVDAHAHCTKRT